MAISSEVVLSGGTWLYARTQKREMPSMLRDLARLRPGGVSLWTGSEWCPVDSWDAVTPPGDRKVVSARNRSARYRGVGPTARATYDFQLRSGERIGCLGDTVFPTSRGDQAAQDLVAGDVLTLCQLPEPEASIAPLHLPDEIIGWFVGLYMAEGSQSEGTLQIASNINEVERFRCLKSLAAAFHATCAVHATGGKAATANLNGPVLNGIVSSYASGRTAKDKHLNVRCWERSNKFLRALLDGYLSADAHYDEQNDRWRMGFTLNDAWASDLRTISARLALSLRLKHTTHTTHGHQFPGYRGEIRFAKSAHHNVKRDTEIVAVEQNRARRYYRVVTQRHPQCFALASGVLCGLR